MKYLWYIFWLILFILSFLFFWAYLDNHTYYFNMLASSHNWYITIFWLLITLAFSVYLFFQKEKTWKWVLWYFVLAFFLFSIVVWMNKWWFATWWFFILIVNYLILFTYWALMILWFLALWDLVLQKLSFKKSIYEFAVKLWLGLSISLISLYFIVAFQFLHIWISYLLLIWLVVLTYLRRKNLWKIFSGLLSDLDNFSDELNSANPYFKYIFVLVFAVAFWYIFIGLNYTFIPYPTAWDANHAYMFLPRVFWIYDGYPWNIDFRPDLYLWSGFLAWMYKLGNWTWFAPDTWMITSNFLSWIFALLFGFMLISTLVRYLEEKKVVSWIKKYLLLLVWYILLLARLTSWNGAFLLFVDNKTDIAVLMYIILALFLVVYSLSSLSKSENRKKTLIFVLLAGFFFGIANLIKPTATFDFFESTLVLTILEIGFLTVVWMILFVSGLLAYLKFRWFQKAVSPTMSYSFMGVGSVLAGLEVVWKFLKNKFKIIYLLVFVWSFLLTMLATKWTFGLLQIAHWEKINPNLGKTVPSLIMSSKLPTLHTNELTWSLYKNLKKDIWSSYNEDNWRYMGYGSKDFWNVWWSVLVPSYFKDKKCLVFNKNIKTENCSVVYPESKEADSIINQLTIKIYNNKNDEQFEQWIEWLISQQEKNGWLKNLAQKMWINTDSPDWKLKKDVFAAIAKNSQANLLRQIKSHLQSADINPSDYPKLLQTEKNLELFRQLQTSPYIVTTTAIPYKYLTPFNVTFNWSLQNLTSYYTDIGITWLILFFIVIYAFVYWLYLVWKWLIKKDMNDVQIWRHIFAFSFATLVGWTIWYFVASGIIWYNIWGIIWLIITTLIFLSKWEDDNLLIWVLLLVSVSWIFLNLIRISSQWWGEIQTWYRSSVWKVVDYKVVDGWVKPSQDIKIPYIFDDVFHLQFNLYKKPINAINARTWNQMAIIGWTYMRYFVNNQNNIKADQFLKWLWKMWSDSNVENTYKRFKQNNLKDIVIDPNIASVVMWTWNISLWYRYYWKVNTWWNITEKWVLPMFVDLASKWYLKYGFTNNLGIKYALIYSDEELSKILWISDLEEVRKIRYEMTSLKFLPRDIWFEYPNTNLGMKMYEEWIDAFYKVLTYRLQEALKWNTRDFASDLMDVNGLYIPNLTKILSNWITADQFNKYTTDEKMLVLQLMNILNQVAQNPSSMQQILKPIIQNALWGRAQLVFVKVK